MEMEKSRVVNTSASASKLTVSIAGSVSFGITKNITNLQFGRCSATLVAI